jgi:hypothetical protein
MTVHEEMDSWPEQERRERNWYPLSEAKDMCKHAWMAKALYEVEGRLQEDPSLAQSMHNLRADTDTELFHDEQVLICTKETKQTKSKGVHNNIASPEDIFFREYLYIFA